MAQSEPFRRRSTCDPIRKPKYEVVGLETKEVIPWITWRVRHFSCAPSGLSVTRVRHGRDFRSPVRFTLTSTPGSGLDGAWWPHSVSIARELSDLTDALHTPLGKVIEIGINWSPLQGVPDLDLLNRRGVASTPARDGRHLRVITVTGSRAKAQLLVVPCRTSIALATMLLRQAANLPVLFEHQHTTAFHTAGVIVRAARTQNATSAAPAESSV